MWETPFPQIGTGQGRIEPEGGTPTSPTTQTIFTYMSDAHSPAVDVQTAPQDAGMPRSFSWILRSMLIGFDG